MITLVQFPPAMGLPNASPFCLKLETWLRMAGIDYRKVHTLALNRAPKGKFPYIEDGGKKIGDSTLAIEHLRAGMADDALDGQLTAAQCATALLLQRTLEEHLYWCVAYFRWVEAAGWAATRDAFFGGLKPPLSWIVPPAARRAITRQLWMQGVGRHSRAEVVRLGCADLDAVADTLGAQPYLLGGQPSSVDACGYGFLANILLVPLDTPLKQHAQMRRNLVAYCERMRERYWADA